MNCKKLFLAGPWVNVQLYRMVFMGELSCISIRLDYPPPIESYILFCFSHCVWLLIFFFKRRHFKWSIQENTNLCWNLLKTSLSKLIFGFSWLLIWPEYSWSRYAQSPASILPSLANPSHARCSPPYLISHSQISKLSAQKSTSSYSSLWSFSAINSRPWSAPADEDYTVFYPPKWSMTSQCLSF